MKIKKLITINEDVWKKLEQLKEEKGLLSTPEALRYALGDYFNNPAYVEILKKRMQDKAKTPEEKAKEKIDLELAKIAEKKDRDADTLKEKIEIGRGICRVLGGKELKPDGSGIGQCQWNTIDYINPMNASLYDKKMYFDDLSAYGEEEIHKQFYNSVKDEIVPKEVAIEGLKNCKTEWPTK